MSERVCTAASVFVIPLWRGKHIAIKSKIYILKFLENKIMIVMQNNIDNTKPARRKGLWYNLKVAPRNLWSIKWPGLDFSGKEKNFGGEVKRKKDKWA